MGLYLAVAGKAETHGRPRRISHIVYYRVDELHFGETPRYASGGQCMGGAWLAGLRASLQMPSRRALCPFASPLLPPSLAVLLLAPLVLPPLVARAVSTSMNRCLLLPVRCGLPLSSCCFLFHPAALQDSSLPRWRGDAAADVAALSSRPPPSTADPRNSPGSPRWMGGQRVWPKQGTPPCN